MFETHEGRVAQLCNTLHKGPHRDQHQSTFAKPGFHFRSAARWNASTERSLGARQRGADSLSARVEPEFAGETT
jgi:hypothetical protein